VTRTDGDGLGIIGLLALDGVLVGALGLAFTPLYVGGVPLPLGVLLTVLVLPWLVLRAGEIDPRSIVAGAPLLAWFVTLFVLGLLGPGGDVLLPVTWQSGLLFLGGLGAGLIALRRVLNSEYERDGDG
jgi:hypothetical protein